MLKFVPDHLMTKKMTNMQLKTTFHEKNSKTQKVCNKAANMHPSSIQFCS